MHTHTHTHPTPQESIRRGIVLTRQVPEDERTLEAYFAISNPVLCVSHAQITSVFVLYTQTHVHAHGVCARSPRSVPCEI